MSDRAAYSRVYWSVMDDAKFDGIRENVRHFGSWCLLLIVADMAYPAPAYVPAVVPLISYRALVTAGLIDDMSGRRFRIHGLASERTRRAVSATRQGPNRVPTGTQAGPNRDPEGEQDETRRDETRQDEAARAANDPWDAPETEALQWLAKHGCDVLPGNGYHRHLVTMVEVHGVNAVVGMFDRLAGAGMKQGDTQGYVFGAKDALNARTRPNLQALEKDEAVEERAEARSKRIQSKMWERRMELYRESGQWDEAWGPEPSKEMA